MVTTTDNATIETTSLVTTDLTSTTTTSTVDDVKKYPQCFNKKNDKPKRKHCCFDNDGKVLYPKPCSVTSKGLTTKTGDDTIIPTSLITTDSSSTTATSTIDDVKKYPQCFNKKNDKPKRKHCCFDNNDRVLYPKPCTKTSERTASTTAKTLRNQNQVLQLPYQIPLLNQNLFPRLLHQIAVLNQNQYLQIPHQTLVTVLKLMISIGIPDVSSNIATNQIEAVVVSTASTKCCTHGHVVVHLKI